jgi:hypothetical protein
MVNKMHSAVLLNAIRSGEATALGGALAEGVGVLGGAGAVIVLLMANAVANKKGIRRRDMSTRSRWASRCYWVIQVDDLRLLNSIVTDSDDLF